MDPAFLGLLIGLIAVLGGIPLAGFSVWLDFKSKHQKLGASTHELEKTVADLRDALEDAATERRRLIERMQNVETIVTSQAWDTLGEPPAQERLGEGSGETRNSDADSTERTEALAQQVQG